MVIQSRLSIYHQGKGWNDDGIKKGGEHWDVDIIIIVGADGQEGGR